MSQTVAEKPSMLDGFVELAPESLIVTNELLLSDRCDACSAAALIRAVKDNNLDADSQELLFCGSHGKAHVSALVAQSWLIDDQTHRAFGKSKPSQT